MLQHILKTVVPGMKVVGAMLFLFFFTAPIANAHEYWLAKVSHAVDYPDKQNADQIVMVSTLTFTIDEEVQE